MTSTPTLRRLRLGLPTLLGLAKRGYFIPYRYAGQVPADSHAGGYPFIAEMFERLEADFLSLLSDTATIRDIARRFDGAAPPAPRWQQSWFPRLDGLAAYLMTRRHQPARIMEIGSGHSTRFLAVAIADGGFDSEIWAIDPKPRADIAGLGPVTVHRRTLQEVPPDQFRSLKPGDFLMIDSSHIAVPGSDVDLLLGRIVPLLPAGTFLQIHDMFLPDAYPETWEWRGYNEQLPVAALLAGGGFRPVWSSHWIASRCAAVLSDGPVGDIPLMDGAFETALWLEKL
ncbi:MAG: class I SAM-dependent methyltransferase [Alphaproteobacteria bacterium]